MFSSFFRLFCLLCVFVNTPVLAQRAAKIVDVASPTSATVAEHLSLSGSFSAEQHSLLSPREDGLVAKLWVDAGSKVNKGDRLLELDDRLARLAIQTHQSALKEAEVLAQEAGRLVAEAERLRTQRHIPESELIKRQADAEQKQVRVEAMKAALATAQETLNRHTLYAPFDGVITRKQTEVGEWISRGDAVLTLTNLDRLRLHVTVPQERFAEIKTGTEVVIRPDMAPSQTLSAQINTVVPVSDEKSRAFEIRLPIKKGEVDILPGMSATVEIPLTENHQQTVLIPRDALLIHPDGGHSVFVVNSDNTVQRRSVEIGERVRDGVVVIRGLGLKDIVVIRGNEVLNDGDAVLLTQD